MRTQKIKNSIRIYIFIIRVPTYIHGGGGGGDDDDDNNVLLQ